MIDNVRNLVQAKFEFEFSWVVNDRHNCLRLTMIKSLVQVKFEFVTVEMVGEAFEQVVKDQK